MLKINLKWQSVFFKDACYAAKLNEGSVRRREPNSAKYLLLCVDIKGVCKSLSEEIMYCLAERLNGEMALVSDDKDLLLSNKEWGFPAFFDENTRTYTNVICIPKNYDNLPVQKETIMKLVRTLAKGLRYEYFGCACEEANMYYESEVMLFNSKKEAI